MSKTPEKLPVAERLDLIEGKLQDLERAMRLGSSLGTHIDEAAAFRGVVEGDDIDATDAAAAKAAGLGVDLAVVEGTGADGRVLVSDVEAAAATAAE